MDSLVQLDWITETVHVLGADPEPVLLPLLQSGHGVSDLSHDIWKSGPEIIVLLSSFNNVACK